jgi:putative endonuclease
MKEGCAIVEWLQSCLCGRFFLKNPHILGLYGETLACRELKRRGFTIVERRVRGRLGEIDIVAWDGPVLVFVEVKTRSGTGFGTPAEAVGWRKQRKLVALAHVYLARKRLAKASVRFDVVSVVLRPGRKPQIEVLQGAFQEA